MNGGQRYGKARKLTIVRIKEMNEMKDKKTAKETLEMMVNQVKAQTNCCVEEADRYTRGTNKDGGAEK